VPSKKRSSTSRRGRRLKPQFFIDRNLGSHYLPLQLRQADFEITIHDDLYQQTERDPLIFYECGKKHWVVVTSDTSFAKSFPHMAAISLGRTTVIAFTQNNYKSEVRGSAFIKARREIEKALNDHRGKYFIGVVGMNGTFRVCAESPLPTRKTCDRYEAVCKQEGVLALRLK
jgi:hypothetical protein